MKRSLLTFAGACLVLGATSVSAIEYIDFDYFDGSPLAPVTLGAANTFYSDNFNIATGDGGAGDVFGYNSATETIASLLAEFAFTTMGFPGDPLSTVTVDLGAVLLSGSVDFGILFHGETVAGSVAAMLGGNGILNYTVNWVSGPDVALEWAGLTANSAPLGGGGGGGGGTVPDAGSTLGLMGLAFAGLVSIRKRLAR